MPSSRIALIASCLALALPASAQGAGSAYVGNGFPRAIDQYTIGPGGKLASLTPATIPTDTAPSSAAVHPDGNSAYFGSLPSIYQYDVDSLSGKLTPKSPPTVANGGNSRDLALTPDGSSLYAAVTSGEVFQYDVDPGTGELSPKTPASVPAGSTPVGASVSPDGDSLYVVNIGSASVSQYDIDPVTGKLTPKTPPTVATEPFPGDVAVTPNGESAYVTNFGGTGDLFPAGITISQYDIHEVTGALTPKTPGTVTTGENPDGIVVSDDGESAYVANAGPNTVSQYDVHPATGQLSPKSPASVPAGLEPSKIALAPDGTSAYVTNLQSNTVSQYSVDPSTGALSAKSPATVPATGEPYPIATGPLPTPAYPRPKGASPIRVSLALAFKQCTAPNRVHGGPPPLDAPSCNPPVAASNFLTVGTPDWNGAAANSTGFVRWSVQVNPPPTPNDVRIVVSTTDVRCLFPPVTPCGAPNTFAGADYAGDLQARAVLRLTDKHNGVGENQSGTVADVPFAVTVPCASTDDTTGAVCSVSTSANAVVPGSVQTGKRAIWALGPLQLYDGGSSGTAGASDATLFQDQGIFIP